MLAADTQADIGPDLSHLKEPAAVCSSPSVLHNATSTQSILPVVAATNQIIQVLQGQDHLVTSKTSHRLPGVSDDLLQHGKATLTHL